MRRLKVGGQVSAGTTFIELDDVKVPVENLIGEEGMGMKYIMTNFNHERLTIAIGATRQARVALGAAMEYVMKREAFGKPLIDQPVVRHRLAKAGADPLAEADARAAFVAAHVKTWDLSDADGKPVPVTAETVGKLPVPVLAQMPDVCLGYLTDAALGN